MSDNLITDEEIEKIKSNPKSIDFTGPVDEFIPVIPVPLSSGYYIGYSIDILSSEKKFEHVSIGKPVNPDKYDPVDEEHIIIKLLGTDYISLGSVHLKSVRHYMKEIK